MTFNGRKIGVIGGGAWGTALAQVLAKNERDVLLWAMEQDVVDSINKEHENDMYLPAVSLHETLKATNDLHEAAKADVLLLVTPAQYVRTTLESIKGELSKGKPVVICSKGIELNSGLLLTQVAEQVVPDATIAVLTGPTFAREIAMGLPGAVTIACKSKDSATELQGILGVPGFRPYATTDVIGTQLGGAIKNVIAIACGVVMGRQLGESARAALLTRGVAEIARLGVAMGAKRETLLGMCGIGDLTLTCGSMQSRNFSLGAALGEGKTADQILGERKAVTEGVHTVKSTLSLAKKHAVDMPITETVSHLIEGDYSVDTAIEEMLNRPFSYEITEKS